MNFRDYQEESGRTAADPESFSMSVAAYAMGLAGETGELVDLLKKDLFHGRTATLHDIESEAGDVLWYLANLCRVNGIDLQQVAEANLVKLKKRYPNGFVKGGGVREEKCEQFYWHGVGAKGVRCGEHSPELDYTWLCPDHYRSTRKLGDE